MLDGKKLERNSDAFNLNDFLINSKEEISEKITEEEIKIEKIKTKENLDSPKIKENVRRLYPYTLNDT